MDYPDNVDFHIIFNGPHVEVRENFVGVDEPNDDYKGTGHFIPSDAESTEDETTDED